MLLSSGVGNSIVAKAETSIAGFYVVVSGGAAAWASLVATCGVTCTDTRKGGGSRNSIPPNTPVGIVAAATTYDGGRCSYSNTNKIARIYIPISGEKNKSYLIDNGSSVTLTVDGLGVSDSTYQVFGIEQPQLSDLIFTIEPYDYNNGTEKAVDITNREGIIFPCDIINLDRITIEFKNSSGLVSQNAIQRLLPEMIQESMERPDGGGMMSVELPFGLGYDAVTWFVSDNNGTPCLFFDLVKYIQLDAYRFRFQPAVGASGKFYVMDLRTRAELFN